MHELPRRQTLQHTPPPWVRPGEIFFVTICCKDRSHNQLARDGVWQVIEAAVTHYHRTGRFWAHLVLVMPDHLHALLAFPSGVEMSRVLRDWKRFVAKESGIVWQDGFFDHRLRNEENLEQKAGYIRMNPVRAGLVTEPLDWKYACTVADQSRPAG